MISNPCVIILDSATSEEREAVQSAVKQHANGWWHYFGDAWIAGGHTPVYWQNVLKPLLPDGRSSVLILALPEGKNERKTGGYMIDLDKRMRWIRKTYKGEDPQ